MNQQNAISTNDLTQICSSIPSKSGDVKIFSLQKLTKLGIKDPQSLPFSIKILLENVLRNCGGDLELVKNVANWTPKNLQPTELSLYPGRVLLQDFTGVPCVVDLAALRSAMKRLGGDRLNSLLLLLILSEPFMPIGIKQNTKLNLPNYLIF